MTDKLKDGTLKPIGRMMQLALSALVPSEENRDIGSPDEIRSLARSISAVGLLYPLIIRKLENEEGKFEILAGTRRYKALLVLKAEFAPCVVVTGEAGERGELLRVVENHQRKQMSPLEEAAAVRGLLDLGWDMLTVARSLGRSKAWVSRRASLTELSEAWLQELNAEPEDGQPMSKIRSWPPSHLEIVARFPAEIQDRMLDVYGHLWRRDVPTLADLVQITGEYQRILATAPWPLDDATLCPEIGACAACIKRSAHHPELFPEELPESGKTKSDDRCLDPECWKGKAQRFILQRIDVVHRDHPDLVLLDAGENGMGYNVSRAAAMPLVHSSDVATCKKSEDGAVPALVVAGPGLGRLKYIQTPEKTSGPTHDGPREEPDTDAETPQVRSIEERREAYDKRRRQIVIDAVREKLMRLAEHADWRDASAIDGGAAIAGKGMVAKSFRMVAAMLDIHGWKYGRQQDSIAWPSTEEWQNFSTLRNHDLGRGEQQANMLDLAWFLLRLAMCVCAKRIAAEIGTKENGAHYAEAAGICRLLNLDLKVLQAEAAEKIPYAKIWRDEVNDDWAAELPPQSVASTQAGKE